MDKNLPALQRKTLPFTGTEAEGPHQGDRVLFIPGTVTAEQYLKVRQIPLFVKGLYYGAGNCRDVFASGFEMLAADAKKHNLHLTVEVDHRWQWLHWARDRYQFTVVYFDNDTQLAVGTDYLKGYADFHKTIKDNQITWTKVDDPRTVYVTPLDSPLFAEDQDLDIGE